MLKHDAAQLGAALNALAETFGKPAVTPKALEVWFDTLHDFPTEEVMPLLRSWPKIHGKFPVPSEVWKTLNERAIDAREQRYKSEKAQRAREYARIEPTREGKRCLSEIYRTLMTSPKPEPLEHWRTVMDTPGLPFVSYEYAKLAIARLTRGRKSEEPASEEASA